MDDKRIYWSFRMFLGFFGCIAIYKIVDKFVVWLNYLVELYKLVDTSPEMRLLLICISIWVNVCVIKVILDIVIWLHTLLEEKFLFKKYKKKELI